jgi:hypothetical protein
MSAVWVHLGEPATGEGDRAELVDGRHEPGEDLVGAGVGREPGNEAAAGVVLHEVPAVAGVDAGLPEAGDDLEAATASREPRRAPGTTPTIRASASNQSTWPKSEWATTAGTESIATATRLDPMAERSGIRSSRVNAGTTMRPPPRPRRPATKPLTAPTAASATIEGTGVAAPETGPSGTVATRR